MSRYRVHDRVTLKSAKTTNYDTADRLQVLLTHLIRAAPLTRTSGREKKHLRRSQ